MADQPNPESTAGASWPPVLVDDVVYIHAGLGVNGKLFTGWHANRRYIGGFCGPYHDAERARSHRVMIGGRGLVPGLVVIGPQDVLDRVRAFVTGGEAPGAAPATPDAPSADETDYGTLPDGSPRVPVDVALASLASWLEEPTFEALPIQEHIEVLEAFLARVLPAEEDGAVSDAPAPEPAALPGYNEQVAALNAMQGETGVDWKAEVGGKNKAQTEAAYRRFILKQP